VNVRCAVSAVSFTNNLVDFESTELLSDVNSLSFAVTQNNACGYPITYTFTYNPSSLESWLVWDSTNLVFTIKSSTVTPTYTTRT